MATLRYRRKRRRVGGIVPRLGHWLVEGGRSIIQHPQPFIVFGFLLVAGGGLWSYAQRADAFRITSVQLPADSSLKLPERLIGENLWDVNLRGLADALVHQQPWLKEVRVIRQLPSTIRVEAIPRRPVAKIRFDLPGGVRVLPGGRWYLVDQDGFILPEASGASEDRLVRLTGFEHGSATLKIGKDNTDERLKLALRILTALQRLPRRLAHRVTEINVADSQQLRFLLDGAIEVRCGSEAELSGHLDRLVKALKTIDQQRLDVRYIDVRFQEPVVAPRT